MWSLLYRTGGPLGPEFACPEGGRAVSFMPIQALRNGCGGGALKPTTHASPGSWEKFCSPPSLPACYRLQLIASWGQVGIFLLPSDWPMEGNVFAYPVWLGNWLGWLGNWLWWSCVKYFSWNCRAKFVGEWQAAVGILFIGNKGLLELVYVPCGHGW